jgi:hypothetical protein
MTADMRVRGFTEKTRNDYVRNVRAFAAFIGRSPDTATMEDLRRFQLHQTQIGMQPPSINSAVAALRFFFTVTLDRPGLRDRCGGPSEHQALLLTQLQAQLARDPSAQSLTAACPICGCRVTVSR